MYIYIYIYIALTSNSLFSRGNRIITTLFSLFSTPST